jgi:tetratricopeptide (TPR) repeat protein
VYLGAVLLLRGLFYKQWVSYFLVATLVAVISFAAITVGPEMSTARAEDAPAKQEAKRCFEGEVLKGLDEIELSEQAYKECEKPKDSSTDHFWSWMATAAKDILGVLGFLALLLALAALFLWGCVWVQIRTKTGRKLWPAKKLWTPSLVVESLDDTGTEKHLGPAVASLIRDRVRPAVSGGARVVTGHATIGESLKPLGEISDEAKAAMGVITLILNTLPRREYEATGSLQALGEDGCGISIEANKGGDRLDAVTLWAKEFQAPDDERAALQFLSIPAAAWLDHRIATDLGNTEGLPESPKVWALFNAGSAWQQRGDTARARPLYEEALALDPEDFWSMSNLGVIEFSAGNYPKGERLLLDALEALENDAAQQVDERARGGTT